MLFTGDPDNPHVRSSPCVAFRDSGLLCGAGFRTFGSWLRGFSGPPKVGKNNAREAKRRQTYNLAGSGRDCVGFSIFDSNPKPSALGPRVKGLGLEGS